MFNKGFILQAKALAKAARNGEFMLLTHTHPFTPYTPSHPTYTAVNQKILHEEEVEKTFVELLSSEVGLFPFSHLPSIITCLYFSACKEYDYIQ